MSLLYFLKKNFSCSGTAANSEAKVSRPRLPSSALSQVWIKTYLRTHSTVAQSIRKLSQMFFYIFTKWKKKIVKVSWHSSLAVQTSHQFEDIFFEDLSFSNISVSLHVLRLHFSWPYYFFFIRRMKTLRGLPFLWGDEYAKQIIKKCKKTEESLFIGR